MISALVNKFKDVMNHNDFWLYVRLIIIASGVIGGVGTGYRIDSVNLSLSDVIFSSLIILIVSVLGIFLMLTYGFFVDPNKGREWRRPSWRGNPFKEPLQFFHLCAFYFIASGLAVFLIQVLKENRNLQFPLELMSSGMGLWLGIQLYMKIFQHQITTIGKEGSGPGIDFKKFRGSHAFVLRDSNIVPLWRLLQGHSAVVAMVRFGDSTEISVSSPQEIIRLENSGYRQIETMQFISQTNSPTIPHYRQLEFSNRRSFPIEWEIAGNEEEISRLNDELKKMIKGLKPWYGKISEMNFFSLIPIGGMMGGLVAYLLVALIDWRPITEQIQMSSALFLGTPLLITFFLLVPLAFNQLRARIFPLASFAIGQGKGRYRIKEKRRRIIISLFSLLIMVLLMAVYLDVPNK